jgi:hypothetical protein
MTIGDAMRDERFFAALRMTIGDAMRDEGFFAALRMTIGDAMTMVGWSPWPGQVVEKAQPDVPISHEICEVVHLLFVTNSAIMPAVCATNPRFPSFIERICSS